MTLKVLNLKLRKVLDRLFGRNRSAVSRFADWIEMQEKGQDLAERRVAFVPDAANVNEVLSRLPVARRQLLRKYAGAGADPKVWEDSTLRDASKWLGEMNALSLYSRQGLAWCQAYITTVRSLDRHESESDEIPGDEVSSATVSIAYHLRNALQDLYAFRERFAQFCNAYCGMGLKSKDLRWNQVFDNLKSSTCNGSNALLNLSNTFGGEEWAVAMQIRNMIVHRSPSFPGPEFVPDPLPEPSDGEPLSFRVARLTEPRPMIEATSENDEVIRLAGIFVSEYVQIATLAYERMMGVMNGTLVMLDDGHADLRRERSTHTVGL